MHYCNALAARGRIDACLREADLLPAAIQQHPAVLYLRGTIAARLGDFAQAAELARSSITQLPQMGHYWHALAMAHRFAPGDPDLARMEALAPEMRRTPADSQAAFFYALGKARHDCGDYDGHSRPGARAPRSCGRPSPYKGDQK